MEGESSSEESPLNGQAGEFDDGDTGNYNDWRHCRNHNGSGGNGGGGGGDDISNSSISLKSVGALIGIVLTIAFAWGDLRSSVKELSGKIDSFASRQEGMEKNFHAHEMEDLPHGTKSWVQALSQRQDRLESDMRDLKAFITATCNDGKKGRVAVIENAKDETGKRSPEGSEARFAGGPMPAHQGGTKRATAGASGAIAGALALRVAR